MGLNVLQITDTHLLDSPRDTMHGVNTQNSLEAVLDQALAEVAPDVVLATGDIAEAATETVYQRRPLFVRAGQSRPARSL